MSTKTTLVVLFLMAGIVACKKDEKTSTDYVATPLALTIPDRFPTPVIPDENPLTVEGVRLGRMLYYDPILSTNGLSCSSCHMPQYSFSKGIYISPTGARISVPPHINLAWNPDYNWDGSEPILNHLPMGDFSPTIFNTNMPKLVVNLKQHDLYPSLFKQAFNIDDVAKLSYTELQTKIAFAIAQFVRTMVSCDSKFDRVMHHTASFTTQEANGYSIFTTETGDCFHCHDYPLFTSNTYSNNGLEANPIGTDVGHFIVTHSQFDIGKFSVPTLRNIELTAPYMHDGRFNSLEEVVEFYNSGVHWESPNIDPIMTKPAKQYGLNLTAAQKADLVAFLKTLTDTTFMHNPNYQSPF